MEKRLALLRVIVTRDEAGNEVVDEHGDVFDISDVEDAANRMMITGEGNGAFEIAHKIPGLGHVVQSMTFSQDDWAAIGVTQPMAEQWLVKVFVSDDAALEAIKQGRFPGVSWIGDTVEVGDAA
jgi:hypothetical protein